MPSRTEVSVRDSAKALPQPERIVAKLGFLIPNSRYFKIGDREKCARVMHQKIIINMEKMILELNLQKLTLIFF
jgi:hypothetical protein